MDTTTGGHDGSGSSSASGDPLPSNPLLQIGPEDAKLISRLVYEVVNNAHAMPPAVQQLLQQLISRQSTANSDISSAASATAPSSVQAGHAASAAQADELGPGAQHRPQRADPRSTAANIEGESQFDPSSCIEGRIHFDLSNHLDFTAANRRWPNVFVVQGDITQQNCGALVNAANQQLWLGGGVAGALRDADESGTLQQLCTEYLEMNGNVPKGEVAVTCAGSLPCKFVFHAVGPQVGDAPTPVDQKCLFDCVMKCLQTAYDRRLSSIALPFLSTGVFNYPLSEAVAIYADALVAFLKKRPDCHHLRAIYWVNDKRMPCKKLVKALTEACDRLPGNSQLPSTPAAHDASTSTSTARSSSSRYPADLVAKAGTPSAATPTTSTRLSSHKPPGNTRTGNCHADSSTSASFSSGFSAVSGSDLAFSPFSSSSSPPAATGPTRTQSGSETATSRVPASSSAASHGAPLSYQVKVYSTHIPSFVAERFRAAGVLPIRRTRHGALEVLLAFEYRFDSAARRLNLLGGSKNWGEEPGVVARREFCEEIGGQLDPSDKVCREMTSIPGERTRAYWIPQGKYLLYTHVLDSDVLDDLPDHYIRKQLKHKAHAEADALAWVSLTQLRNAILDPDETRQITWLRGNELKQARPSKFIIKLFRDKLFCNHLFRWLTPNQVKHSLSQCKALLAAGERKFAEHWLGRDWQLHMDTPVLPPPSPIKALRPGSRQYRNVASELPQNAQQSLVSIRNVNVAARRAVYARAKQAATGKEQQPVYHGTPERWRATAIATHGFDLKIRLNGRALGDGVYSATDASIPLGYGSRGAVLRMMGIVGGHNGGKTHGNNVIVFPDPSLVLPTHIYDFASSDERDMQQSKGLYDPEQAKKQLKRDRRKLAKMEDEYRSSALNSWRRATQYYHDALASLHEHLGAYTDDAHNVADEADVDEEMLETGAPARRTVPLIERLEFQHRLESFQFHSKLPIYSHKGDIIRVFKQHAVIVFQSGTGSGKSTQLPQYLLDNVFGEEERRKIGVLQPRRINVTSLCERVSQERQVEPGTEVGYRMGRGAVLSSDETRIEFMTHGLFVMMASNPELVLSKYSAIILDEAHERSVEIDLSFAYLRQILAFWRQNGGRSGRFGDFKVVVASATIDGQAEMFRRFLDPDGADSTLYEIKDKHLSFPVLIQYRDDVALNSAITGTRGAAAVLTSLAAQTAMDILNATPSGDVLVFVPGESEVSACMYAVDSLLKWDECPLKDVRIKRGQSFFDASAPIVFEFRVSKPEEDDCADGEAKEVPKKHDKAGDDGSDDDDDRIEQDEGDGGKRKSGLASMAGAAVDTIKAGVKAIKNVFSSATGGGAGGRFRVAVLPLYGKLTKQFEMHVNKENVDRMIIFSTNVAETGVTLRNVRYVVDTGQERVVRWNPRTGLTEMVTRQATQSSMRQRAGRAGRTTSGVCVRLYSKKDYESAPPHRDPEIRSGMVTSTLMHLRREDGPASMELLQPIPQKHVAAAEAALQAVDAMDDSGSITQTGKNCLELGLDMRVARLLMACVAHGCAKRGSWLAAVMCLDAPAKLLPPRLANGDSLKEGAANFVECFAHESGDHLTLLNMCEELERNKKKKLSFCRDYGLSMETMSELLEMQYFIESQLSNVTDYNRKNQDDTSDEAILNALCAAYSDQLVAARTPGKPEEGFVRLLSDEQQAIFVEELAKFRLAVVPAKEEDADNEQSGHDTDDGDHSAEDEESDEDNASSFSFQSDSDVDDETLSQASGASASSQAGGAAECRVRLGYNSILWHMPASSDQGQQSMLLYTNVILTDNANSEPTPQVELATYVSADRIQHVAQDWCSKVNFDRLKETTMRKVVRLPMRRPVTNILLRDKGRFLRKVRGRYARCAVGIDKRPAGEDEARSGGRDIIDHLRISAPEKYIGRIVDFAKAKIAEVEPETISFDLPEAVNVGKLIGKKGANKNQLLFALRQAAMRMAPGSHDADVRLVVDSSKRKVELHVQGKVKLVSEPLVGMVQNAINDASDDPTQLIDPNMAQDAKNRLRLLMTKQEPFRPRPGTPRDQIMLYFAHYMAWQLGLKIKGGFVRDWVVAGQPANDIDAEFGPGCTRPDNVVTHLTALAQQFGLTHQLQNKPNAQTVELISSNGSKVFEVDLVDPNNVPHTPPGVDADVNNLAIFRDNAHADSPVKLDLKVSTPKVAKIAPVSTVMKHIQDKKFIFFYDEQAFPGIVSRRLNKMRSKGYTRIGENYLSTYWGR